MSIRMRTRKASSISTTSTCGAAIQRAAVGHQRAIDGRLARKTVRAISGTLRSRMIGVAVASYVGFAGGAAAASEQRLTYTVQMSPYGTIGTYQSAKQKNGDETTITT